MVKNAGSRQNSCRATVGIAIASSARGPSPTYHAKVRSESASCGASLPAATRKKKAYRPSVTSTTAIVSGVAVRISRDMRLPTLMRNTAITATTPSARK